MRELKAPVLWLFAAVAATACARTEPAAPAGAAYDHAPMLAEARREGAATLRVVYVPAEGFAYRGAEGRPTGVTVDIMRAFAAWLASEQDLHVELDFVEETDWRTFYSRVREGSGGVFGLGNVTITDARRQELQFSPAYMTNVAVLITHESIDELTTLEDVPRAFAGLRPLGFEGTLHETRVRALRDAWLPGVAVELAGSNGEILERVGAGCCFAWIDGYNFWRARDQGAPLRRHAIGDDPAEEFGIIMPPDSDWPSVLAAFLGGRDGFRMSPQYDAILVRHLGEAIAAELQRAR
jgi:ABC-type amino acid transport substrate-binding protein